MRSLKLACVLTFGLAVLAGCQQDQKGAGAAATGQGAGTGTGAATLSWEAPTTYTNGAALTGLAGYQIYYGTSATNLTHSIHLSGVGTQTYVVDNLGAGTWYFAVIAIAGSGAESSLSQIVSKTIG